MENIIGKPLYPSASGGAVANSPPKPPMPLIRENTRLIQPIPGGEQTYLGHKANSADEAACSTENSQSRQPIPGGGRTDLDANP